MRQIDVAQIQIANAPYRPLYSNVGYSKPGPHERDEPAVQFFFLEVSANQILRLQPLQVDPDATFLWRGTVAVLVDAGAPGDCKVSFQDPWLNQVESINCVFSDLNGNIQPSPRYPEVPIPGNGVFYMTVEEYTGGASDVFLAIYGVKRFKC